MELVFLPNQILRQKSQKVVLPLSNEDEQLAKTMIKYVDNSQNSDNNLLPAIGIAAVQLGQLKRMLYINIDDDKQSEETFKDLLINPIVIAESIMHIALNKGEGCLSIKETEKNINGLVHRKSKIIIKAYSYFQKKEVEYSKFGYLAIVIQHEIDHLNGILYIDRIDKENIWKPKKNEILI